MATCFQVPMVPSSLRSSSSSSSSSSSISTNSSFDFPGMNQKIGWRYVNKKLNYRCSSSKIELPPIDPNDPFIRKLAAHVQNSSKLKSSSDSDLPPFLDLMTEPTQPTISASGLDYDGFDRYGPYYMANGGVKMRSPPPDLPSILFDGRIVYLGMPMVPAVAELIMAEFLYLQWVDDESPVYLYINSTGTCRDDDVVVAHDSEGFAIYDVMTQIRNQVETVCLGACVGHATLLLSAGKKGRRFMLPHCRIAMKAPNVAASGLMQATDIFIHSKEAVSNRDMLFKLFAYHTGHRLGDIIEILQNPLFMGAKEALEFGVVDKVLWEGQEDVMPELLSPEQWAKLRVGKLVDDP